MSADDNGHRAVMEPLEELRAADPGVVGGINLGREFAAAAGGQEAYFDARSRKIFDEGIKMLLAEDFSWRQVGHRQPGPNRRVGRGRGHHGFARTDLAGEQPEHWSVAGKIRGDSFDGLGLPSGEGEGQAI